ncbi:MAG TPA: glycosyltransferase [Vicinamibacterales bacterium]
MFQKLDGPEVIRLIDYCNALGAVTVYVECDWRPEALAKYRCAHIVCPSRYLQHALQSSGSGAKVHFIPDPIEASLPAPHRQPGSSYRIVWTGSRANWPSLDVVRAILAEPEFRDLALVTISDHHDATHAWEAATALQRWADADVCVIPTSMTPHARAKSNNRLTQAMALGLPVVCGAIPAYADIVADGINGFVCDSADRYRAAFRALRNADVRHSVATEGWRFATDNYSLEGIISRWERLFHSLAPVGGGAKVHDWRGQLSEWTAWRRQQAGVSLQFALIGCPSAVQCGRYLLQSQVAWPFQLAPFAAALRKAQRKAGAQLQ